MRSASGKGSSTQATADTVAAALLDPAVAGITRLTAIDTVRARIALAIRLGLMAPGDKLPSYKDVGQALGVSEITARRALESLADDGALARRRGRGGGTFVTERAASLPVAAVSAYLGDADKVHDLIDQRALLECAMAHHAALAATSEQLDELDSLVERGARAKDWSTYHVADEQFHLAAARASGLSWALPRYTETLQALFAYFLPYPVDYLHAVNEQHAEFVAALRDRDPVAAVAIIEAHVLELHRSMFIGLTR